MSEAREELFADGADRVSGRPLLLNLWMAHCDVEAGKVFDGHEVRRGNILLRYSSGRCLRPEEDARSVVVSLEYLEAPPRI